MTQAQQPIQRAATNATRVRSGRHCTQDPLKRVTQDAAAQPSTATPPPLPHSFMMEYDIHTVLDALTLLATCVIIYCMTCTEVRVTYQKDQDKVQFYYVVRAATHARVPLALVCAAGSACRENLWPGEAASMPQRRQMQGPPDVALKCLWASLRPCPVPHIAEPCVTAPAGGALLPPSAAGAPNHHSLVCLQGECPALPSACCTTMSCATTQPGTRGPSAQHADCSRLGARQSSGIPCWAPMCCCFQPTAY